MSTSSHTYLESEELGRNDGNIQDYTLRNERSTSRNPTSLFAEPRYSVTIPPLSDRWSSQQPKSPNLSSTAEELRSRERSRLNSTARELIRTVSSGDTIAMVAYINRHYVELLRLGPELEFYLEEAVTGLRRHDNDYAKSCIEKGIIINDCKNLSSAEMATYLSLMHRKDAAFTKRFQQRYDQLLTRCKLQPGASTSNVLENKSSVDRGGNIPRNPSETVGTGVYKDPIDPATRPNQNHGISSYSISRPQDSSYGVSSDRMLRHQDSSYKAPSHEISRRGIPNEGTFLDAGAHASTDARRDGRKFTSAMQNMNISGSDRKVTGTLATDSDTTIQTSLLSPTEIKSDEELQHGSRDSRTLQDESNSLSSEPKIRGPGRMAPDKDLLDPRFVRRSPKAADRFFTVGRVFAILQHSEHTGRPNAMETKPETRLTQSRGVWILSRVSRFVVVRKGHGHCWAIPISTYNDRGLSKKGLRPNDFRAHAIIYSGPHPPAELPGEPKMAKMPIAVDTSHHQRLAVASRVDFSRVITVEHNVRAMDIGQIRSSSRRRFEDYWKSDLLG